MKKKEKEKDEQEQEDEIERKRKVEEALAPLCEKPHSTSIALWRMV